MTDDEYRDMQEVAHQLRELTKHSGWGALVEYAHTAMRTTKDGLLNGNVANIDEYRKRAGWLTGIHFVIEAPATMAKIVEGERVRREERAAAGRDGAA